MVVEDYFVYASFGVMGLRLDIYAVQKDGVTIGWYATEEAAKNTAKATDGKVTPYYIIDK